MVDILQRLTENGNTVLVIEHNLDVIKTADYVIDLGPEGGDGGGYIIAQGTPEEIAEVPESYTGIYLKPLLVRAAAHPMEEEHHRRQQARKVSKEALEISTSTKPRRKNAFNSNKG